jgi:hypothetical protein
MIKYVPNILGQTMVKDLVNKGFNDLVNDVLNTSKEMSPVKTGNNRRRIQKDKINKWLYNVETHSGYGLYLEAGTYKMSARPYLYPALCLHANKAGEYILRYL